MCVGGNIAAYFALEVITWEKYPPLLPSMSPHASYSQGLARCSKLHYGSSLLLKTVAEHEFPHTVGAPQLCRSDEVP